MQITEQELALCLNTIENEIRSLEHFPPSRMSHIIVQSGYYQKLMCFRMMKDILVHGKDIVDWNEPNTKKIEPRTKWKYGVE